jgi:hypothetical protein
MRSVRAGVVLAVTLGGAATAKAEDPPVDGATLVRSTTTDPAFVLRPWRGLEARMGRDLTWARWMMAGDGATPDLGQGPNVDTHAAAPWLDLASIRDEAALMRPRAGESAVSAIGSMVTAGLPVLAVWRGGKLRARHVLRGYFRNRGVALAWRIEF